MERIFFLLHCRFQVQLSLVILESEFDIIIEFIIVGRFGKLEGGAVPEHERIQGIAIQTGDLFYNESGEPVADEFILLVFNQPGLECSKTTVWFKPEYIDQLVQVKARTIGSVGDTNS